MSAIKEVRCQGFGVKTCVVWTQPRKVEVGGYICATCGGMGYGIRLCKGCADKCLKLGHMVYQRVATT